MSIFLKYTQYIKLHESLVSILEQEDSSQKLLVSEEALVKFKRVSVKLMVHHAFFSDLFYSLKHQITTSIPTMATDGSSIYINPDFLLRHTDDECLFVIAHEILHNTNAHFIRNRPNPDLWNQACDYAINPLLVNTVGKMPEKGLINEKFYGMSAEQIYDILDKEVVNKDDQKKQENQEQQDINLKVNDIIKLANGEYGKVTAIDINGGNVDYEVLTKEQAEASLT